LAKRAKRLNKRPLTSIPIRYLLGPIAFSLDGLRLLGRPLATFAGQSWLKGLNGTAYFPTALVINIAIALWLLCLAKGKENDGTNRSPS
jgi:hypothetical protein